MHICLVSHFSHFSLLDLPGLVEVTVVARNHLEVKGCPRVTVEVGNESFSDLMAPGTKVGCFHDRVGRE